MTVESSLNEVSLSVIPGSGNYEDTHIRAGRLGRML